MSNLRFGWGFFRDLIDWTPATLATYGQPQVKAEFLALASDAVTTVSPAVTAHAGGGQGSAVLLTADYTNVSVCATAGDSVKLPTATTGATYTVKNNGVANLAVFPNTSDTIDGGSANASITLAPGTTRLFTAISAVDWESNQAIVANGTVFTLTTGITAFAGGGQSSAVALTTYYNNITTSATAGDSVKLLTAAAGTVQVVTNSGASAIDVFPFSGDTINGGAANAAISVPAGATVSFAAINSTDWKTNNLAIAAGAGTVTNPSITFNTDADTGFYSVGNNIIGASIGGVKTLDIRTAQVSLVAGAIFHTDKISEVTTGTGITFVKNTIRQATATAVNVTATVTAANVAGGLLTSTSVATVAITLPSATDIATLIGAVRGTAIDFIVDNSLGANTVTVIVGSGIAVATPALTGGDTLTVSTANVVGQFRLTFTSATTAIISRIV